MTPPTPPTIDTANRLQVDLAGKGLTASQAKLYSQHTRLRTSRPGLTNWRRDEASERLDDAVRLLEAGFVQREAGNSAYRACWRGASEILEWLSHPQLNTEGLPFRLL